MPSTSGDATRYCIWWSGTEGQALWLQHFSPTLSSMASIEEMPSSASSLPSRLRPLFALEHPDLVVSTTDGIPLLSIEITEQQAFGSNSQQRMARMWSAVANHVASAYLLPIESYQIDFDASSRGKRLLALDDKTRDLALFIDTIPGLTLPMCLRSGVTTPESVPAAVRSGEIKLSEKRQTEVLNFLRRHVINDGPAHHLPVVPRTESYHAVGDRWFRAYLRRPGVPESMVLMWLKRASDTCPAFPFQIVSELAHLFETNGIPHLLSFPEAPHLQFQNLPLPPGQGRVVHRESGEDEMTHFFRFVESAIRQDFRGPFFRELFTHPNEYFDKSTLAAWRRELEDGARLTDGESADFRMSTPRFILEVQRVSREAEHPAFREALDALSRVNVLRAYTSTARRPLGDPYTGMLATRDLLFCREGSAANLKENFSERQEGLAFWVELRGKAAAGHTFLATALLEQLRRNGIAKPPSSMQEAVTLLLQRCHPDQISKSIRGHLIFSDVIVVQRTNTEQSQYEVVLGLPSLLRLGALTRTAAAFRGLFT